MRNEHDRLFHCPFASHRGGARRSRNSENRCARHVQCAFIFQRENTLLFFIQKNRESQLSLVVQSSSTTDVFSTSTFLQNFWKNFFFKKTKKKSSWLSPKEQTSTTTRKSIWTRWIPPHPARVISARRLPLLPPKPKEKTSRSYDWIVKSLKLK